MNDGDRSCECDGKDLSYLMVTQGNCRSCECDDDDDKVMINLVNEGVLIMLTYSKIMMIIIMVTFGQHGNDQLRLKWCGTLNARHGDIPRP